MLNSVSKVRDILTTENNQRAQTYLKEKTQQVEGKQDIKKDREEIKVKEQNKGQKECKADFVCLFV